MPTEACRIRLKLKVTILAVLWATSLILQLASFVNNHEVSALLQGKGRSLMEEFTYLRNISENVQTTPSTHQIDPIIAQELESAGINITTLPPETLKSLPTWSQISKSLGDTTPHIVGMEQCASFQDIVGDGTRYIGVSGLFNSGTNLLSYLLEQNCILEKGKVLWQVPWGKHSRASRYDNQTVKKYERFNKTKVLTAVAVRHPFEVMESFCRNSYTLSYPKDANSTCPHMVHHSTGKLLPVKVGKKPPKREYPSIADFWNEWNQEYVDFEHPRLMVRLEDLTVRPKETIGAICGCAGGSLTKDFTYSVSSAKAGDGHGEASESTGLLQAWSKLGRAVDYHPLDYGAAKSRLSSKLLNLFHYSYPEMQSTSVS